MITLKLDNGKEVIVPATVDDIQFGDYYDFKEAEDLYFKANEEGEMRVDPDETLDFLIEAVGYLVKGAILDLEVGKSEDTIKDGTLFGIYNFLIALINGYTPQELPIDFGFTWKGQWFMIDPAATMAVLTGIQPTTLEAITLLELSRLSDIKKTKGMESTEFNFGLEHLAVLCRKPGEQLPTRKADRTAFIDRRKHFFAEVPMTIPLDLRFFLAHTLADLSKIAFTNISFTRNKKLVQMLQKTKLLPKRNSNKKLSVV